MEKAEELEKLYDYGIRLFQVIKEELQEQKNHEAELEEKLALSENLQKRLEQSERSKQGLLSDMARVITEWNS